MAEHDLLLVTLEGEVIQSLPLSAMSVVTIGRLPDNSLALPHPAVALRGHAELRIEAGSALLTDLGSPAGTYLAGERLLPDRPALLVDGATFRIGPFVLVLSLAVPDDASDMVNARAEVSAMHEPAPPLVPMVRPLRERTATARPFVPHDQPARYLNYLPAIFQEPENELLSRYLKIFETIWEPYEQRQDNIAMYFDPRSCPPGMLPWLASWLDLELDDAWPVAQRRAVLYEAVDLYHWRGTEQGLVRLLELCLGVTAQIEADPKEPFVVRIRLDLPPERAAERKRIEALIVAHKPAHLGYRLELR